MKYTAVYRITKKRLYGEIGQSNVVLIYTLYRYAKVHLVQYETWGLKKKIYDSQN